MRILLSGALLLACAAWLPAAKNLQIYAIDVEGGQATLMVTPGGESLLVDTGWGGHNHRDADRILAAAKSAGVKKIDYLVVTHYHADHVGGVYQLAEKIPILHFVDHGPSIETGKEAQIAYNEYLGVRGKGQHIEVKPGDTLPIKGLEVKILSAAGSVIPSPLPRAGEPNPACKDYARPAANTDENGQSIGMLITFGGFRMLDMGDETKDREFDLVCPNNKIGPIDFFLVSHHGMNLSNSAPFVHAITPRVALMNNGARKGGTRESWQTVHDTRGLLDLWQLHYAIGTDKEHNSADTFIANVDAECQGMWLKVVVEKDGTFTVSNPRNKFKKTYPKK